MVDQPTPENGSAPAPGGPATGVVTPAATPGATGAQPTTPWARDAAIFFPPIARSWSDQDTFDIVRRLQWSMNRVATESARFKSESRQVNVGEGEMSGKDAQVTLFTISRTDVTPEQRILDVYPLNYHDRLEGDLSDMPLLKRIMLITWATIVCVLRAIRCWNATRSKGAKEMWQFALSAGGLALLGVYLILLVVAMAPDVANVVRTVTGSSTGQSSAQTTAGSAPVQPSPTTGQATDQATGSQLQSPPGLADRFRAGFAWLSRVFTVVVAALALYSFKIDEAKQFFVKTGEIEYSIVSYFENDSARNPVLSQLQVLANDIASRPYAHLYLIGYSFGSLIALDALFPRDQPPDRSFGAAKQRTLVTIGCPFDYIRSFWPEFWSKRHVTADLPRQWINVYIRRDVLGSNFRDDTQSGDASHGINSPVTRHDAEAPTPSTGAGGTEHPVRMPDRNIRYAEDRDLGWTDAIRFIGYAEHLNYWPKSVSDLSAFDRVIRVTHGDDEALMRKP